MKKPYKNTRIKIIIFTVFLALSLFSASLYSATPSYSNFSSNQFSPSGTYTVAVKNQPLLTNIVEHAQLSLTNPAFANSLVYITNMRSLNGLTNTMEFVSTYGPQTQFAWTTNGIGLTNTVMVISNGCVGIGIAPASGKQLHVANSLQVGGTIVSAGLVDVTGEGVRIAQTKAYAWVGSGVSITAPDNGSIALSPFNRDQFRLVLGTNSIGTAASNYPALLIETNHVPGSTNLIYFTTAATNGASGCGIGLTAMYQDPSPYESSTNTLVYSRSNALYVSDPTAAPGAIIQQNASAFMTPATITNLLNVTAGKTNGIFVNTNGPLVYIWSDGWNIYSKTIAP